MEVNVSREITVDTQCLLFVRAVMATLLFKRHNHPMGWVLLLPYFYQLGNRSEKVSNSPITYIQLPSDMLHCQSVAGPSHSKVGGSPGCALNHCPFLLWRCSHLIRRKDRMT